MECRPPAPGACNSAPPAVSGYYIPPAIAQSQSGPLPRSRVLLDTRLIHDSWRKGCRDERTKARGGFGGGAPVGRTEPRPQGIAVSGVGSPASASGRRSCVFCGARAWRRSAASWARQRLGFPPGARRSFAGARRRSKPARRMSGTRRTPGSRPRWANSRWRARSCGRRSTAWRPAAL